MKIRNLLFGFVLAMMFLCAGNFTVNTVKASPCTDYCGYDYNNCMIDCNGSPLCQSRCWRDYNCCIDTCNTGACDW
jgi:hypothetical protein